MSMCRTSTSGRSTTPNCGINSKLQPCRIRMALCSHFRPSFPSLHPTRASLPPFLTLFCASPRVFSLLSYLHVLSFSSSSCGSVGRMAWLCVPSSTDTDLTSSTTPNWERYINFSLSCSCSDYISHFNSVPKWFLNVSCQFKCSA